MPTTMLSTFTDDLRSAFARRPAQDVQASASQPLLDWAKELLPEHFAKPPSGMHQWLADQLDGSLTERGRRINVLGPRGSAKSTVATLAHVIRAAVENAEPYIWIVSDTKPQARTHLENIKTELTENRRLAERYPAATGKGPKWAAGRIELAGGVVIEAFGAGQQLRGRRRRAERPSLIVCDDLENERHGVSASRRAASREWFGGTLLKAGTAETNIVNLATALHREALAMQLHRSPGWSSRLFQSIAAWPDAMRLWDQWESLLCDTRRAGAELAARDFYASHRRAMHVGAQVLWPEVEDLQALMRMRALEGHAAFEREKQNSPIDPARCEWPESYFDEHVWFDDWPTDVTLKTMAIDPSKGVDARHGDYSAIVMLAVDADGVLHVDADLQRRPTPQMVADAVDAYGRLRPDAMGVEANQWQQLLSGEFVAEFLRRGQLGVEPVEITNTTNKQIRIRRLGPYLAQRRLRFRRGSAGAALLVDQLRDFPLGDHDDGPDALEMALRLAEQVWQGRLELEDGLGNRLPIDP